MIEQYTKADKDFAITVTYLLDLASRAYELFQSSKVDQKRQLLNFVLSNLRLEGKKLLYDLKKPFDSMLVCAENKDWLPLVDMLRTVRLTADGSFFGGINLLLSGGTL